MSGKEAYFELVEILFKIVLFPHYFLLSIWVLGHEFFTSLVAINYLLCIPSEGYVEIYYDPQFKHA
jgi:hypothetical protein